MYIEYDKEVDAAYIWLVDNIEDHKKKFSTEIWPKELNDKIEKEQRELFDLCKRLSVSRKKAAEKLASGVEKQLQDLGMKKVHFKVSIEKA